MASGPTRCVLSLLATVCRVSPLFAQHRADAYVTFDINPDGTIDRARMAPASPAVDFSFDFQDRVLRPVQQ
jgi:hypothetical protein